MANESDRAGALRAFCLVEGGVEASFSRLAKLAVGVTRAPMCVLAFGDEPAKLIKACAGPPELSPADVLSTELYRELLCGTRESTAIGEVAGAVVRAPSGLPIGAWCARTVKPRTWTKDALDALEDIARLTEVELALRERKRPDELAALILESMSDACVLLDAGFRYAYVNEKAGKIFGREARNLVGKHIWTEFPDGVGQRFDLAYQEAIRTQQPAFIEEYYPPWKRWFENRIYPSPNGLAIFFQDVTARKEAEEERRKELLVRSHAEQMAHVGLWVWNIPENRVTWSDELYRIYGLDESTFGASFDAYLARVHPQDFPRVRETVERAVRERVAVTFEERIVRPSGEIRHLHSWGNVVVNADGQPVEMRGACLDMTELIVTSEGLRRTGEWLTVALESVRVAVFEWAVQTNVVRWTDGSERAFGISVDELGKSFDAYLAHVHAEDRDSLMEALRVSVEQGTPLDHEHRIAPKTGGERWVGTRGTAFADASSRVTRLVGTIVDVTERRLANEQRRKLEDELRHAQKMDAIGRLAYSVAHDFNNLLTVIRTSTQVLSSGKLSLADQETVSGIDEAAKRATGLASQLLAFSRLQNVARVKVDLEEVVRDACGTLKRLLPEGISLVVTLAPGLPPVLANRSQLDQVLLNLVVNARDAMPNGGSLTITTRAAANFAELEVRDTGVGMSAELRSRVFEPFFTTKNTGNGIGLATVYGIVTASGGTIEVESAPGEGAAFIVRLPVVGM